MQVQGTVLAVVLPVKTRQTQDGVRLGESVYHLTQILCLPSGQLHTQLQPHLEGMVKFFCS